MRSSSPECVPEVSLASRLVLRGNANRREVGRKQVLKNEVPSVLFSRGTDSIGLRLPVSGRYYHPPTVTANEGGIELITG